MIAEKIEVEKNKPIFHGESLNIQDLLLPVTKSSLSSISPASTVTTTTLNEKCITKDKSIQLSVLQGLKLSLRNKDENDCLNIYTSEESFDTTSKESESLFDFVNKEIMIEKQCKKTIEQSKSSFKAIQKETELISEHILGTLH